MVTIFLRAFSCYFVVNVLGKIMRLKPIENPSNPLLKFAYWMSTRQFGKVLSPLKVIYSRKLPLLWLSLKLSKFEEKQNSLPPDLRFFIKIAAAAQNGCTFCTDIGMALAVKNKIGTDKFNALLSDDVSKQSVFSKNERAVYAFVREYAEVKNVSDETFADLQRLFTDTEIVEIVAINAFEQYYNAIAIPLGIHSDGLQKIAEVR